MRINLACFIVIVALIIVIPLSYAFSPSLPGFLNKSQVLNRSQDYPLLAILALSEAETPSSLFIDNDVQFHCDEKINGSISPVEVNGRPIHPYAHSYKKVTEYKIKTGLKTENMAPFAILPQLQLKIALTPEIGEKKNWMHIISAQEGSYEFEGSLDLNNQAISLSGLDPTPIRTLDHEGLLALDYFPISSSEIKSSNSLKYSGKEINDIESSSNSIGARASASATLTFGEVTIGSIDKTLLDKRQIQSMNAEFLYNKEFTKESNSNLKSGIFLTTDSLLNPTYAKSSIGSTLDYNLSSHSNGVADISHAQSQTSMFAKPVDIQRPVNEGRNRYVGNFDITTKIHMDSKFSLSPDEDYWLPCCSGGFDDMNTLDKRAFRSAAGVFDCTCFIPNELPSYRELNRPKLSQVH